MPGWQHFLAKKLALKPAIYGAYTELYAGLHEEIKDGSWIVPWGSMTEPRKDIAEACRPQAGKTCMSETFWGWCEKQVAPYV